MTPNMRSLHRISKLEAHLRSVLGVRRPNFFREYPIYPPVVPSRGVSQAVGAPTDPRQTTFENLRNLVRALIQFRKNKAVLHQLGQLRQLVVLLRNEPEAAEHALKVGIVPTLVELRDCGQSEVEQQARLALTLLGYAPPYSGRGLRILAIDGGGTRGVIPIVMLRKLEELCDLQIHEMFDYVCGTSTGAIVASLVSIKRSSTEEVETMFRELSTQVFKMNNLLGIGQLFLNHAFYDTKLLQKIIRNEAKAENLLFETAADPLVPKISYVSTVVNQSVIQPFLFCNYRHHPANLSRAHYQSTCDVRVWEAIMASTAAPGYFEEVKLGNYVHQDGGLLTNNPCAIALHEARLLWGESVPIQCIISLGTGLHQPQSSEKASPNNTSLKGKLIKIVASATDTEAVHTILKDLLPSHTYFRFNPKLSEDIPIDESNPAKLNLLVDDARACIEENRVELERAVRCLLAPKKPLQKVQEWTNSQWNRVLSRTHHLTFR